MIACPDRSLSSHYRNPEQLQRSPGAGRRERCPQTSGPAAGPALHAKFQQPGVCRPKRLLSPKDTAHTYLSLLRFHRQADRRARIRELALADRSGPGAGAAWRRATEPDRTGAGGASAVPPDGGCLWRLQQRLDESPGGGRPASPDTFHRTFRSRSGRSAGSCRLGCEVLALRRVVLISGRAVVIMAR